MNIQTIRAQEWDGNNIDADFIIFIDHFADEVNDTKFDTLDCNKIISDHYSYYNNMPPNTIFYPGYFVKTIIDFKDANYNTQFEKSYCFNFMIHKSRINRCMLIGILTYFKLDNCKYTWAWTHTFYNTNEIMDYISKDEHRSISSLDLKNIGFNHDLLRLKLNVLNLNSKYSYHIEKTYINDVFLWWDNGLNNIFEPAVVSLITEPVGVAKSIMFTEKTCFAIVGLSFPIWIGGYRQAEEFKKLGFNTFDDIIDHSYQFEEHFIDRCFLAIKNNLRILTDFEYANKCFIEHKDRLITNRDFLQSAELRNNILKVCDTLPIEITDKLICYNSLNKT